MRLERKLLYVFAVFTFNYSRKAIALLIDYIYEFNLPILYLFAMNLGQIIGGATIYIYQVRTLIKKEEVDYFGIELIHNETYIKQKDNCYKILLLIHFLIFMNLLYLWNIFLN